MCHALVLLAFNLGKYTNAQVLISRLKIVLHFYTCGIIKCIIVYYLTVNDIAQFLYGYLVNILIAKLVRAQGILLG